LRKSSRHPRKRNHERRKSFEEWRASSGERRRSTEERRMGSDQPRQSLSSRPKSSKERGKSTGELRKSLSASPIATPHGAARTATYLDGGDRRFAAIEKHVRELTTVRLLSAA
jgi:hypothetical protein